MGPTWVLLARDGSHVGPMNLFIRVEALVSPQIYDDMTVFTPFVNMV